MRHTTALPAVREIYDRRFPEGMQKRDRRDTLIGGGFAARLATDGDSVTERMIAMPVTARLTTRGSMLAVLLLFTFACSQPDTAQTETAAATPPPSQPAQQAGGLPPELRPALDKINANDLLMHTKTLSSDEYE